MWLPSIIAFTCWTTQRFVATPNISLRKIQTCLPSCLSTRRLFHQASNHATVTLESMSQDVQYVPRTTESSWFRIKWNVLGGTFHTSFLQRLIIGIKSDLGEDQNVNCKRQTKIVYQYGQSRISGGAARGCYRMRSWKWHHGSDRVRMRNRFPCFFSYYSSSTKCTIAHDRHGYRMWPRRDFPWKGARMRNRKLCNIRPSFPALFQTATFKISVSCFSSTWRYKTFHFPVLFQTATFAM
jgi:hypothetical protein